MTLRTKTIIAVAAALVGLLVMLYLTSNLILLRSFAGIEEQSTREHVERVRDALLGDLSDLDRQLADWAAWDETYTYVEKVNPDYVTRNIPNETFVDLRLNLILIIQPSGRIVYGRAYDWEARKPIPLQQGLTQHLTPAAPLLRHRQVDSKVTGMIALPDHLLLVASRPILTSDRKGPIQGTMIMGRYLSAGEVRRLAEITHLSATAYRADAPRLPVDIQRARARITAAEPIAVLPAGNQTIAGYALLNDIYDNPVLVLRVEGPRVIYNQGRTSVGYFILWFVAVGLVFGGITVTLFDRLVVSRHGRQESEGRYSALVEKASPLAIMVLDPGGNITMWNAAAERTFGWRQEEVLHQAAPIVPPERQEELRLLRDRVLRGDDFAAVETVGQTKRGDRIDVSISAAPLRDEEGKVSGIMAVVADISERKRAEERIHRQLQRLAALRTIDVAISASLDLRVTLNVLLDQVITHLGVHAADVLLLNPHTRTLGYAAGRGFRTAALQHTRLRLGEGHAGRAALERGIVSIADLVEAPGNLARAPLLKSEGFQTYHAATLIAKGEIKGVLEVFHREPLAPDPDWMEFLEALAGQAAIAIDSASLFDNLQRANVDLTMAYDTTLEGWSRALDLRDEETEGHTRRVTELTLRLAREMGVPEADLVYIRRGALLHDIGKMGIPDSILLKPGPLTDEEWVIMRRHPIRAYELLSPITYLRPALDIPYAHHEKWDGTGYPRGLKEDQIPLAARIFAVADVWDALTSDRPYRKAWPAQEARDYIREQAGKHFDPKVVDAFLAMDLPETTAG